LFSELDDKSGVAQAKLNLGNVFLNQGRLDDALEHIQHSLAVFNETRNLIGQAISYENLSIIYSMKGLWDDSNKFLELSRTRFREAGDYKGAAEALRRMEAARTRFATP